MKSSFVNEEVGLTLSLVVRRPQPSRRVRVAAQSVRRNPTTSMSQGVDAQLLQCTLDGLRRHLADGQHIVPVGPLESLQLQPNPDVYKIIGLVDKPNIMLCMSVDGDHIRH